MSRTTLARPLSAGSIIIESSFFKLLRASCITNKRSFLSDTTMNNIHIFNDNSHSIPSNVRYRKPPLISPFSSPPKIVNALGRGER